MYAIILTIWIQSSMSLAPYVDRFELVKDDTGKAKPIATLAECRKAASALNIHRPEETDPKLQYVWQEAECKKVR